MSQHKMQQSEAFELLRRTSQNQNRKLYELDLDGVATGELPHAADRKRSSGNALRVAADREAKGIASSPEGVVPFAVGVWLEREMGSTRCPRHSVPRCLRFVAHGFVRGRPDVLDGDPPVW